MIIRRLELLSPAANAKIATEAILHGADAVYIGGPSHGARKGASNSLDEISKVVDFAHQYRAKVYVTVNTIVYDNEINRVEQLCRDLYHVGVDALIIQDLGILRMKIPPIALHASTQTDIRTPDKAKFLEEVGFSQLVLARELSLTEIKEIADSVKIPIETFVHGALCVSYSGRCHASFFVNGRSANRGECAQICRLPYSLVDSKGKTIEKDKYLLSLKDLNSSHSLPQLIKAGVSSFKIEGRLKDGAYVKNITAYYNKLLNDIINRNENLERSSFGDSVINFAPDPYKSFNRGYTQYFQTERNPLKIASLISPKSFGEPIKDLSSLNNGDGIGFIDKNGQYTGVNINKVEKGRIIPARKMEIPSGSSIFRTFDVSREKIMNSNTATRKIPVAISLDSKGITAKDTRGLKVRISMDRLPEVSRNVMDYKKIFQKLGNTIYTLSTLKINLPENLFFPYSFLTAKRRELLSLLDKVNIATYKYDYRIKENIKYPYPLKVMDFMDNVSNERAKQFYKDHGVEKIEEAAEISINLKKPGKVLMSSRYCILRELGLCCKKTKKENLSFPLYLRHGKDKFRLIFDCKNCEMRVLYGENK